MFYDLPISTPSLPAFHGRHYPQARTRRFMRGATIRVIARGTFRHQDTRFAHNAEGRAFRRQNRKSRKDYAKACDLIPHGQHPPMRRADGTVR